jgi:hypothetical protein
MARFPFYPFELADCSPERVTRELTREPTGGRQKKPAHDPAEKRQRQCERRMGPLVITGAAPTGSRDL